MEFLPEILLAVITVLSTGVAAIANQSKWTSKTKNMVAFVISVIIAVGYLILTGQLTDLTDLPTAILAVYGLQQLVYKQFLQELAKRIEAATDVSKGETVIVEEGERNEVIENGGEDAKVVIKDADGDGKDDDTPPRADRVLG